MSVSPQSTEKSDHGTTRAQKQKKKKRRGILKRVASGLTSLAGIATAIATITTSAAAVLGVAVHARDTQLQQAHAQASTQAKQIRDQAQQIQQLQKSASAPPAAPSQPGSSGTQVSGGIHYLSTETPTVENAYLQAGQQVIAAKPYVNTIIFSCDAGASGTPDLAYDVAGSSRFTTEIGIPDNMQNATGVIATVIFSNESGQQVGQQVQVSLGHPVSVKLDVTGITQLGMTCAGRDRQTNQAATNFQVALGNAGVS